MPGADKGRAAALRERHDRQCAEVAMQSTLETPMPTFAVGLLKKLAVLAVAILVPKCMRSPARQAGRQSVLLPCSEMLNR